MNPGPAAGGTSCVRPHGALIRPSGSLSPWDNSQPRTLFAVPHSDLTPLKYTVSLL